MVRPRTRGECRTFATRSRSCQFRISANPGMANALHKRIRFVGQRSSRGRRWRDVGNSMQGSTRRLGVATNTTWPRASRWRFRPWRKRTISIAYGEQDRSPLSPQQRWRTNSDKRDRRRTVGSQKILSALRFLLAPRADEHCTSDGARVHRLLIRYVGHLVLAQDLIILLRTSVPR
jgi:hypothetical protein